MAGDRGAHNAVMIVHSRGFSLIELITAIVLLAIIMIPAALMIIEYIRSIAYADVQTITTHLANNEMALVNVMSASGRVTGRFVRYLGYPYDLYRFVGAQSDPYKTSVELRIWPNGLIAPADRVLGLSTFVGGGQTGIAAGSSGKGTIGPESNYFSASGGTAAKDKIVGIAYQNSRPVNITMKGAEIYCLGPANPVLYSISMKNIERLPSGSRIAISKDAGNPTAVNFKSNFYMQGNAGYINCGTFRYINDRYYSSMYIRYVFIDGSKSRFYRYDW